MNVFYRIFVIKPVFRDNFAKTVVDQDGRFILLKYDMVFGPDIRPLISTKQLDQIRQQLGDHATSGFQLWGLPNLAHSNMRGALAGDCFLFVGRPKQEYEVVIVGKLLTGFPFLLSSDLAWKMWGDETKPVMLFLTCSYATNKRWHEIHERYPDFAPTTEFRRIDFNRATHRVEVADDFIDYLLGKQQGTEQLDSENSQSYVDIPAMTSYSVKKTEITNDHQYVEGFDREIAANKYERNPAVVREAKAIHGDTCIVCGFNFGVAFGDYGKGFIEAHHLYPVSEGERHTNPATDITVLCSNCHRMIHRGDRILTVDELKDIRENAKNGSGNKHE
jgi:hypothetical protein